jgi:uncharacterized membrane protein
VSERERARQWLFGVHSSPIQTTPPPRKNAQPQTRRKLGIALIVFTADFQKSIHNGAVGVSSIRWQPERHQWTRLWHNIVDLGVGGVFVLTHFFGYKFCRKSSKDDL